MSQASYDFVYLLLIAYINNLYPFQNDPLFYYTTFPPIHLYKIGLSVRRMISNLAGFSGSPD